MALKRALQVNDEMCVYYFRNDSTGAKVEEYDTKEEYNRRFLSGTSEFNPTKRGYTFVSACRATKFDTPTGVLQVGDYGIIGDAVVFRHADGHRTIPLSLARKLLGKSKTAADAEVTKEKARSIPDGLMDEIIQLKVTDLE